MMLPMSFIQLLLVPVLFIGTGFGGYAQLKLDSLAQLPYEKYVSDYVKYESLFKEAIQQAYVEKDSSLQALFLMRHATISYIAGKHSQSTSDLLEAIKINEQIGDKKQLGVALSLLGYQMWRKDLDKGISYMRRAISLQIAIKDSVQLMTTYDNFGVLKEMKNELDSALFYYNKALRLKRYFNDTNGIPFSLNKIAGVEKMKGRYAKAIQYLDTSTSIRKALNVPYYLVDNAVFYGDVYADSGNVKLAIEHYIEAVELGVEAKVVYAIAYASEALSSLYEKERAYQDALYYQRLYKQYNDSLVNIKSNENYNALIVQFETAEKEKTIAVQNEMLVRESLKARNRQIWLMVSAMALLVLGLVAWNRIKIAKEKRLQAIKKGELELQSERIRISRDLHDHIGAELSLISSAIETQSENDESGVFSKEMQAIAENAKYAMQQLRETIWAISPDPILLPAFALKVKTYAERRCKSKNVELKFGTDFPDFSKALSPAATINLYRVAQEAINNACKYANATFIKIEIKESNQELLVRIIDNGIGFDLENIQRGNGLANMQARVEEIGGSLDIKSSIGKGTDVEVQLTLKTT